MSLYHELHIICQSNKHNSFRREVEHLESFVSRWIVKTDLNKNLHKNPVKNNQSDADFETPEVFSVFELHTSGV